MRKLDGANLWKVVDGNLADFAQKNADSRGRKYDEEPDPNRLPFQRDRDRVIHTTAFRRLKGKMQVVTPSVGDHFRNRLSHTLEVVQIARDLARQLHLNEDLAEVVALAHDLGHPPFGHAGEEMLDQKMKEVGSSFDHNEQSLRVVEHFERRYPKFQGLNLSHEVLEGIQKHETFFDRPGGDPIFSPHLESQLVDISDEIAYLSADLTDGLRGGFFTSTDLEEVTIFQAATADLSAEEKEHRPTVLRYMIRYLFRKIAADTEENLNKNSIQTLSDVQKCKNRIVTFLPQFFPEFRALKIFLTERYYKAPEIEKMTQEGQEVISVIFDFLRKHPEKMPDKFLPDEKVERRICDYIAGMTDGFATEFYEKVVGYRL